MSKDLDFSRRLYKSAAELSRQKAFDRLMKAELLLNKSQIETLSLRKLKAAIQAERRMSKDIDLGNRIS